ncbi:MAG TPA: hypothetical protein VFJ65_07315 [Solirubrobacterales bacterium]|nr:hypothetical protein [Solirubrobacterales bacterium]
MTLSLGDLIVGVGTLLLAFGTWRLARSTTASVEALDLPFLLASPDYQGAFNLHAVDPDDQDTDVEWALSVEVSNLGSGPAILDGIDIFAKADHRDLLKEGWNVDRPVLPEEEELNIGIPLAVDAGTEDFSPFVLKIFYRSASGHRYVTIHEMEQIRNMGGRRLKFKRQAVNPIGQHILTWFRKTRP